MTRLGLEGTPFCPSRTEVSIMLALDHAPFAFSLTTWVSLGTGVVVTSLVIGAAFVYGRYWRRPAGAAQRSASQEEDLPWQELLKLLQKHHRDRAGAGFPIEKPNEEVLEQLLNNLPSVPDALPVELAEDREFLAIGHDERRSGRRRWGNPIDVHIQIGRAHV